MKKILLTTLISMFSLQSLSFAEITRSNFNSVLSSNGDISSSSTKEEIDEHLSKLGELSLFVNSYEDECEKSDQKDLEYIATKLNQDLEELDQELEFVKTQHGDYTRKLGKAESKYKSNKGITIAATAVTAIGAGVIATTGAANKAMRGMKSVDLGKCKNGGRYYIQHKSACKLAMNGQNIDVLEEKYAGQDLESAKSGLQSSIKIANETLKKAEGKDGFDKEVESLKIALKNSEDILSDDNKEKEEYNSSKLALDKAETALSDKLLANTAAEKVGLIEAKSDLRESIDSASSELRSIKKNLDDEKYEKFKKVIDDAKTINSNVEASLTDVNDAIASLEELIEFIDIEKETIKELMDESKSEEQKISDAKTELNKAIVSSKKVLDKVNKKENQEVYDKYKKLISTAEKVSSKKDAKLAEINSAQETLKDIKTPNIEEKEVESGLSKEDATKGIKVASDRAKKETKTYGNKIAKNLKGIEKEKDPETVSVKIQGSETDLLAMQKLISKFAEDMNIEVKKVSKGVERSEVQTVLTKEVGELNDIKSSSEKIVQEANSHLKTLDKSEKNNKTLNSKKNKEQAAVDDVLNDISFEDIM